MVFSANAMGAGFVAFRAAAIERRIGERGVLTFAPILMLICLWGVALSRHAYLFFILVGSVEGILITAVGTYMNHLIPSAQRATILSFQSMVFSLFMIVLFPSVGALGDRWSLSAAFMAMAAVGSLLCVGYLLVFKPFTVSE